MCISFTWFQNVAFHRTKTKIVKWHWESKSIVAVQRPFRRFFKTSASPCARTILRLQYNFIAKGTIQNENKGQSGRKKFKRVHQIIQKVKQLISRVPSTSRPSGSSRKRPATVLPWSTLYFTMTWDSRHIRSRTGRFCPKATGSKGSTMPCRWKRSLSSVPRFTSRV